LLVLPTEQSSSTPTEVRYVPAPPKKKSRWSRAGCAVFLLLWCVILLIPGFFIYMSVNQEIAIQWSDVPEHRFRIWLVSEIRQRGFGISTASIAQQDATSACVQTDLRYLLWQGQGEPSVYCECYARVGTEATWSYVNTTPEPCTGNQ
jgi:hypothetical protein